MSSISKQETPQPCDEQTQIILSNETLNPIITKPIEINEDEGRRIYQNNANFRQLFDTISHPVFEEFVDTHFRSWSHIQVMIYLFKMYESLNDLDPTLNPFQKLHLLEELARTGTLSDHPIAYDELEQKGKQLYQQSNLTQSSYPVWKQLADVMEHPTIKTVIVDNFVKNDSTDFLLVLIIIYKYLKTQANNPWIILGQMHYMLTDKQARAKLWPTAKALLDKMKMNDKPIKLLE